MLFELCTSVESSLELHKSCLREDGDNALLDCIR
jgi:hypothetical protein